MLGALVILIFVFFVLPVFGLLTEGSAVAAVLTGGVAVCLGYIGYKLVAG